MAQPRLHPSRRSALIWSGAAVVSLATPVEAQAMGPALAGVGRGLISLGRAAIKYGGPLVSGGLQLYDWLTESETAAAGWSVNTSFLNPEVNVSITPSFNVIGNSFAATATTYVDTVHEAQREVSEITERMAVAERKQRVQDDINEQIERRSVAETQVSQNERIEKVERRAVVSGAAVDGLARDLSELREEVHERGALLVKLGGLLEDQERDLARFERAIQRELGDVRSSLEWERVLRELDWELEGKLDDTTAVAAIQNRSRFPATISGRLLAERPESSPAERRWIPLTRTLAPHTSDTLSLRTGWVLGSLRVTSIGATDGANERMLFETVAAQKVGVDVAFAVHGTSPESLQIGAYRNRIW